jgi:TetR/AcrR family transcriptional regulator, cholesterol catabolism regulator
MTTKGRRASLGRRAEVLDAATQVFHEKGYEASSIQDVADALGILKGSLYYYIDSKEDLLFAIIDDVHRSTLEQLDRWLELDGDALTRLRAFLHAQVLTYCRDVAKVGVFLHDFRSLSPEHQQRILDERDRFDEALRDLIRTGQREGVIAPEVDPKLSAMAVFGMMNWISTWWRPGGPSTSEEVAEQFTDLAVAGLATRPDGPARRELGRLPHGLAGTVSDGRHHGGG